MRIGNSLFVSLLLAAACSMEHQFVNLTDSLDLSAGRVVELRAPGPLRTPALSGDGRVCFDVPPPLRQDPNGFAILTPQGRRVVPEAAVVREDGASRRLATVSYLNSRRSNSICLGLTAPDKSGPPYASVRVSSTEPLRLGGVRWLSTDK
jgi:hypothetical protein